jgi:hypothetical protein
MLILSVVVQYIVERIKDLIPDNIYNKISKYIKPSIISFIVSIIITFTCRIDVFTILGYESIPQWLGYVLSALAISGGSVGTNELIKVLKNLKENIEENNEEK